MTTSQSPTHADFQRAAALIGHTANANAEGIGFVLDEASDGNRTTPLLMALIDGYRILADELRTEASITAVGELIELAAVQTDDNDIKGAAQAMIAYRRGDLDAFNAALIEANDSGRPSSLLTGVLDLHAVLFPELAAPYSLKNLGQWTARIARHDGEQ